MLIIKNDDEYLRGIIQDLARGSASTLEMNKSISDANKSISEANRIMALSHDKLIDSNKDANANNKKLLAMVEYKYLPNLNSEDINYQAASDSAVRVIDAMAKTLVRNGQYSNVEEASDYLDTLLNGDSAAAALGHNQKKTDKTNKHKQT